MHHTWGQRMANLLYVVPMSQRDGRARKSQGPAFLLLYEPKMVCAPALSWSLVSGFQLHIEYQLDIECQLHSFSCMLLFCPPHSQLHAWEWCTGRGLPPPPPSWSDDRRVCVCGPAGERKCGTTCANILLDRYNCGSCGWSCQIGQNCFGGLCS